MKKGVLQKIIVKSVELKTRTLKLNVTNMNMSLIRENINVFKAALIVYILVE